jgi:hypothetical protein
MQDKADTLNWGNLIGNIPVVCDAGFVLLLYVWNKVPNNAFPDVHASDISVF